MNRTSLQIKLLYSQMGRAEKKIADWIFNNPGKILPLSITELAKESNSSEATIVRFSRRLGFSGFRELKMSLAQEITKTTISPNITEDDSCFEVFEKVCNDIYLSLEKTKKSLSHANLELACEKLMLANKILIFGLGNSAAIAMDTSHKFSRIGLNAFAYCDNHMQTIMAANLKETDVVIGISHSGFSKDIVEALKLAKANGATTIAITSIGKSQIMKQSDIVLYTDADETKYSKLALNSRIAQLAIIDSLYFHIAYQRGEKSIQAIENVESALASKKY